METTMSKTMHSTSKVTERECELTTVEMEKFVGGIIKGGSAFAINTSGAQTNVGLTPAGPPDVWVGCAWVPQWW
jgi:hypothetical protein